MIQRSALSAVALAAVWLALGRGAALTLVPVAVIFLWKRQRNRGPRLFPQWMRQAILARDGARCRWCGVKVHARSACPLGTCPDDFEADHVMAWADGGNTTLANSAVSCSWCNGQKSALSVDEFAEAVRRRAESLRG